MLLRLLLAFALACAGLRAQPEKVVVLTFDDAAKSHRTVVAPLLRQLGFGATFFITHRCFTPLLGKRYNRSFPHSI